MTRVLHTGVAKAQEIMDYDAALLENLKPGGQPTLHLYKWDGPSATYGYFVDPAKHLNLEKAERHGVSLARRPTGGGIVFHIWDLAFSFLMPSGHPRFSLNTLENYQFVNQIVLEAVREYFVLTPELTPHSFASLGPHCQNFCMARPTQYDVVYNGMKIAGAAQRRRKQGYLHQGTISLAFPDMELLADVLHSREEVVQAMAAYTFAPLGKEGNLSAGRLQLEAVLEKKFRQVLFSLP